MCSTVLCVGLKGGGGEEEEVEEAVELVDETEDRHLNLKQILRDML